MYKALEGLYTYINANFSTMLTTVNTAYSLSIPAPALITKDEHLNDQYPLIEFEPDSGETVIGDEDTPLNDGWEYKLIRVNIAAFGLDIPTIKNTVLVYREVIKRLIKADWTCGGLFNRAYLVDEEYSPLFQIEEGQTYLKAATQRINVRHLY